MGVWCLNPCKLSYEKVQRGQDLTSSDRLPTACTYLVCASTQAPFDHPFAPRPRPEVGVCVPWTALLLVAQRVGYLTPNCPGAPALVQAQEDPA